MPRLRASPRSTGLINPKETLCRGPCNVRFESASMHCYWTWSLWCAHYWNIFLSILPRMQRQQRLHRAHRSSRTSFLPPSIVTLPPRLMFIPASLPRTTHVCHYLRRLVKPRETRDGSSTRFSIWHPITANCSRLHIANRWMFSQKTASSSTRVTFKRTLGRMQLPVTISYERSSHFSERIAAWNTSRLFSVIQVTTQRCKIAITQPMREQRRNQLTATHLPMPTLPQSLPPLLYLLLRLHLLHL